MSTSCNKTEADKVSAVYIMGQLVIWAIGQKPTPCHQVKVEYWPFRIYPPQYQIVSCIDPAIFCRQQVVPYSAVGVFSVSKETFDAMQGSAVVHLSGGPRNIPVKVIELSQDQIGNLAPQASDSGGGMPSPFTAAGGDVPFPFRLGKLLETGRGEDIEFLSRSNVGFHAATGYSEKFSFTEAFQNAIHNLPPDTNPFPDKLTNVSVVGLGANFGGIAGLNRMYVRVVSYY